MKVQRPSERSSVPGIRDTKRTVSNINWIMIWSDLISDYESNLTRRLRNINDGRGALDIARQVKGETGVDTPLNELEAEIQEMMTVWKNEAYPTAWSYMMWCAEQVVKPGYLVNPWGRYRRFPTDLKTTRYIGDFEREAQNFPIQSTIGDTCMIAMWLMDAYRREHNLHFKFINQVHDAVMTEVPEDEIDATKQMYKDTMGSIEIPVSKEDPSRKLVLGVDIDVMTRWSEKVKSE
jgi:DNA polymerase I-like protein with 3'-5' exonuclease and polymerase domains